MNRISALFCCLLMIAALPYAARAQAFGGGDDQPQLVTFGNTNPQLQNLLQLQYQIQVLKRMIEREKSVNDITQGAINLGSQNPTIPAPSETLCHEIPANIPCAQAFKDMYSGFSVEVKKPPPVAAAPPPRPDLPSLVAGSDIPSLEAAALPGKADKGLLPDTGNIYWTDITCLGDSCTAVITPDPQDTKARYRVSMGERLPDGGIVSAISAGGVSIARGKKTIHLEPAPKEDGKPNSSQDSAHKA